MELSQGQIIQKPNKQELSSLFMTHRLNVMHAPVKFHKYIPYSFGVMARKCKCKSYSHFFSKNISLYAIFNDQSFNNRLTNDIVSFEQMGPDFINLQSL